VLSELPRSEGGDVAWRRAWEPAAPGWQSNEFIQALFSGGDSRISTDPRTGLNKYLCPMMPAPDLVCVSSCTASPISAQGHAAATVAFLEIVGASSDREREHRLGVLTQRIKTRLLLHFGVAGLAEVILCPSGTDAILTAAMLLGRERPNEALTAILPSASETGTGVPMASVCRLFDGPDSGASLTSQNGRAVEILLRSAAGSPLCEDQVNDAFRVAAEAATGRVIVYATHSTKTGLIAPVAPNWGTDVIVDACQARVEPETVAAYLRRDWPVVLTGSKFFGGPASCSPARGYGRSSRAIPTPLRFSPQALARHSAGRRPFR
jgi:hypothetical protein